MHASLPHIWLFDMFDLVFHHLLERLCSYLVVWPATVTREGVTAWSALRRASNERPSILVFNLILFAPVILRLFFLRSWEAHPIETNKKLRICHPSCRQHKSTSHPVPKVKRLVGILGSTRNFRSRIYICSCQGATGEKDKYFPRHNQFWWERRKIFASQSQLKLVVDPLTSWWAPL